MSTKKSEYFFILIFFLFWKFIILVIGFFSVRFLPLFSHNYLGGGYSNYITNPLFWGHLNFDGEHYLSIAQNGYKPLEYFFFPLFPYLIKILSFSSSQIILVSTGLLVINLSFIFALIGIYNLVKIDYKKSIAKLVVVLFLFFPTSFYFGNYYTESLFLALTIWSFYFARKKNFLFAAVIASFASATRVVGIAMFPVLFIEYFLQNKKIANLKSLITIFISPFGVLAYMFYLGKLTGDPLIFLHQVSIFGQQRSSNLILLPQVFYRYIFKILPHINYSYFPNFFTTYLEFSVASVFLVLIVIGFWKLRLSYSSYALFVFLIPTLAGSFSSMSRYVLAIFPVFILFSFFLNKAPKIYKFIFFSGMLILMIISTALFWRGYWIS